MQPSFFTGPFAPMCEKFVAQQRAVGKKYEDLSMPLVEKYLNWLESSRYLKKEFNAACL